jgi:hypothetical protein
MRLDNNVSDVGCIYFNIGNLVLWDRSVRPRRIAVIKCHGVLE